MESASEPFSRFHFSANRENYRELSTFDHENDAREFLQRVVSTLGSLEFPRYRRSAEQGITGWITGNNYSLIRHCALGRQVQFPLKLGASRNVGPSRQPVIRATARLHDLISCLCAMAGYPLKRAAQGEKSTLLRCSLELSCGMGPSSFHGSCLNGNPVSEPTTNGVPIDEAGCFGNAYRRKPLFWPGAK